MEKIKSITLLLLNAIVLSIILGKLFIPILKKMYIGQNIREEGPKEHYKKSGTPTMGGIIILLTIIILSIIYLPKDLKLLIIIIGSLGFGFVGFIDDFLKLVMKRSLGLSAKGKLLLQFAISFIVIYLLKKELGVDYDKVILPFSKNTIHLGYSIFIIYPFIMLGTVNAVNLTDGLDGLVSTVTLPVLGFLLVASNHDLSTSGIVIITFGALLGFLVFNSNKASVFMGDTGSMLLGGLITTIALMYNMALFIPIFGFIYLIEALSVIIQVISYKTRNKKRVFLMSPIHHHYELKGYNEQKIVTAFSVISVICCLIATNLL